MHALASGQQLSHYRVVSRLGAGGMGEVYLAEDVRLGRRVALKVLSPGLVTNADQIRRFRQEARAISALNHPNIVTVHDVGSVGDVHFMVTEYVEGETLRARLAGGRFDAVAFLDIATQISQALAAAHAARIVHRDVKPDNVMVRGDGYAKVLDFGLAKLRDDGARHEDAAEAPAGGLSATTPGLIMGTVNYMSPEQARGLTVDRRSDLFSLGVTFYEMLTGQLPFGGGAVVDVIARLIGEDPPMVSTFGSAPASLDPIVSRLLHKLPERRYQSADELLVDLRRLGRDLERARDMATTRVGDQDPRATAVDPPHRPTRRTVRSLAVLPLEHLGRTEELAYLADGLTESLIDDLSRLPRLKVMARSTVFRYKGCNRPPHAIGQELGVLAVLTGRVQQRGHTLSIGVELVDARDGSRLWGTQFVRRPSEIATIQDAITREITEHLRVKLTPAQRKRMVRAPSVDAEAFDLYLKGRYFLNQRSPSAVEKAHHLFEQSIAADPEYAPAHAGLADSHALSAAFFRAAGWGPSVERARAAATRALELDETVAEAHASLAFIRFRFDWDWTGAEAEFRRALELNPGHAQTLHWFGLYLAARRRPDAALLNLQRAQEVDPLSPVVLTGLGRVHHLARRYLQAVDVFRQVLKVDPGFIGAHFALGLTCTAIGAVADADAQATRLEELAPESSNAGLLRARVAVLAGRHTEAERVLATLTAQYDRRLASASDLAIVSAWLGHADEAFRWLRVACDDRAPALAFAGVEPNLEPLVRDARCHHLLTQYDLLPPP